MIFLNCIQSIFINIERLYSSSCAVGFTRETGNETCDFAVPHVILTTQEEEICLDSTKYFQPELVAPEVEHWAVRVEAREFNSQLWSSIYIDVFILSRHGSSLQIARDIITNAFVE